MLLKMRRHVLLKDGEKEIQLCVKHLFEQEREQGFALSRVVVKQGPSGMILQEN